MVGALAPELEHCCQPAMVNRKQMLGSLFSWLLRAI